MTSRNLLWLAATLTLAAAAPAQSPPGACVLNDSSFDTVQGGCQDLTSNLVWSAPHGSSTWSDAVTFAANLVEGGYSDWRLPTLAELQAAHANGASTHIRLVGAGHIAGWSSTKVNPNSNGKNFEVWAIFWDTGQAIKTSRNSRLYFNCVREGSSSLGGGGNQGPPVGAATSAAETSRVTHVLDDGEWTVRIALPDHAGAPFCALLADDARGPASPVPLLRRGTGSEDLATMKGAATTLSLGMLDATGHTTLVIDACALGVAAPVLREQAILLLVVAGTPSTAPVVYRIRLPR